MLKLPEYIDAVLCAVWGWITTYKGWTVVILVVALASGLGMRSASKKI